MVAYSHFGIHFGIHTHLFLTSMATICFWRLGTSIVLKQFDVDCSNFVGRIVEETIWVKVVHQVWSIEELCDFFICTKIQEKSKPTFVVQVLSHGCAFNLLRLETLAITVSKKQIFEKLNSPDTYRRAPVS